MTPTATDDGFFGGTPALVPRTLTLGTNAAPTWVAAQVDEIDITGQTTAINMSTNASANAYNGQPLVVRIQSAGANAITWGALFQASGSVALPTTTVAAKTVSVGFKYAAGAGKYIPVWADPVGY